MAFVTLGLVSIVLADTVAGGPLPSSHQVSLVDTYIIIPALWGVNTVLLDPAIPSVASGMIDSLGVQGACPLSNFSENIGVKGILLVAFLYLKQT